VSPADYLRLLPGAMAVVGITLCEALLLVRSCSRKHNTKADGNQVLFAYGMASVASGFTGSLVSGPSASRTAEMDAAGSRMQLSSLVAAATVALVMVFFTDKLAYLPTAALAGVVASAVLNLILTSLANRGVTVAMSRANQPTYALLSRYHLLELIGKNRMYPTNRHAIAAFRQETRQATPVNTAQ